MVELEERKARGVAKLTTWVRSVPRSCYGEDRLTGYIIFDCIVGGGVRVGLRLQVKLKSSGLFGYVFCSNGNGLERRFNGSVPPSFSKR